jgi:malate dehydrogenase (oxaloacetate-decarboxylating)
VISDGSAVLGLGNIGPEAALPVMEGKSILLKEFAGVDSVPLVIRTQEAAEIIKFVSDVAPSFCGINLEDISAPRCFQIEEALQHIGIPVFHDDQHGTAIVVAAALHNAAKVVGKPYEKLTVVIVGAGAAGLATAKMLLGLRCQSDVCELLPGGKRVGDVIVVDSTGALVPGRTEQNIYKQAVASVSNVKRKNGTLTEVIRGADAVIGVSGPGTITPDMVASMARNAIVFAMANPVPEIMPEEATKAGAAVVATGRSDFPNQINNVLAYPGIFRAVVDGRLAVITPEMKQAASDAIASLITEPSADNIIPDPFYPKLSEIVASAVLSRATDEHRIGQRTKT